MRPYGLFWVGMCPYASLWILVGPYMSLSVIDCPYGFQWVIMVFLFLMRPYKL